MIAINTNVFGMHDFSCGDPEACYWDYSEDPDGECTHGHGWMNCYEEMFPFPPVCNLDQTYWCCVWEWDYDFCYYLDK